MALFRKLFYRKPPDGLLEICERVFVFDSCFSTDVWQEENYKRYVAGVVGQLKDYSPDASFLAFNFREGVQQSQIAEVLSDCDMTVMEYPRQYEGTPLLTMELIHHYLRSGESWLSLGTQNLLLMHCERGGWPILAFMLAALLIYRKQYSGEQKTLDMIYRQAPRELLQLLSPLNPVPSQLRYLQYVSRRNLASEWPPLDRALTLDCVILRLIPNFDGEGGCCPMFRIYGQDPFLVPDRTPKVLFSTPKRGKTVRTYKQAECELVKIDINCHIQGDVVLECLSLDHDREREVMMFRVVFNTAFIRSNILMLIRDEIDMLWGVKDQFPKDFRAEVLFSEMDAVAAVVPVDFSGFDDKDGLPVEAFAKVHEIFSSVDWLDPKVASTIHDDGPHRRVISPTTHHDADSPRRRVLSPTLRHDADLPQSPQRRVITPFTRHGRDNIEESVVHSDNFKSATHGTELLHPPKDNLEKEAGQFNSQEAPRDDGKSNIKSQQINELPSDPGSKPLHRNDVSTENVVDTRKIALPVASHETLAEDRNRPSLPELPSSKQPTMTSNATKVSTPLPPSTLATAPLSETTSASETLTAVTPPPSSSSRSQQDKGPTTSVTPSAATASSPLPPPPPPPPSISPQSVLDKGSTVSAATVPTTPPQPSSSPPNISDVTSPPPSPSNISSKAPLPPPPLPSVSSSAPPPPPPPPIVSSNAPPPPPPPPIVSSNGPSPPPPPPEVSSSAPPPPPPPIMSNSNQVPSATPPPAPSAPAAPSAPPPPPGAGPAPPPPPGKGSTTGAPTPPPPSGSLSSGKGRLNKTIPSKNNQTKKLKPLHWLKLTRAVQGSLWAETQKSGDAKAPEIDIKELESLFSAAVPSSDHHGKSGSRGARGPKVEKVQLIDHRRAYNCEIMLSKVKVPLNELTSSVLNLEDTNLDIDQVENLIKFCPTKEEMELLKGYTGDKEKLGKCEQFFLELMKVPRVESKLRVFSFKLQFSTQVSDLRKSLNTVNSAAEEIRDSAKLKRIMQTILSLGNALNHGTARGSAIGFRLDSLLKLTDTRARNNKMTLMHYLCKVLADKLPEVLDFSKDLAHLELSSKVQLKFLAEEMQSISKGLEKVVQELSSSENDGPISDTFCKKLKEFLCFAEGEVRSLASLYSGVGRNVDALIVYFGEDPVRCSFEQVVMTLLNFVRLFNKAHEENIKHQEREMKKAAENSQKSDTNSSHKVSESLLQTPVQSATI